MSDKKIIFSMNDSAIDVHKRHYEVLREKVDDETMLKEHESELKHLGLNMVHLFRALDEDAGSFACDA